MKWLIIFLVIILTALQVRLWIGERSFAEISAIQNDIEDQKIKIEVQEKINQQLKDRILDLKTGTDAIEEQARSELGLVAEDETFVIVVESE